MDFDATNVITVWDDDNEHSVTMSARLPFDAIRSMIVSYDTINHDNDFGAFMAFKRNVNKKVDELRRALAIAEGFAAMINAIDESTIDDENKWTE
jgi:hypothetical protein